MEDRKFIKNTLLRIKRNYSDIEAIAILQKELAEANFKIGEQRSEITELEDKCRQMKKELGQIKAENNRLKNISLKELADDKLNEAVRRLSEKGNELRNLKNELEMWKARYIQLKENK